MSERILVIGSNSFSGAQFVKHCLEQGLSVAGISRSTEPNAVFIPYKQLDSQNFQFHQLDLNHNLPEILKVVQDFAPEYIVNFAVQGMVGESWLHPEHWYQTNVVATIRLHDELRKIGGFKKYVHISTPEVYGNCHGLIVENTNYNPSTPYAVSRAATDMSLMTFKTVYDFPVVFTRAANVYGPGQQLYRIIPRTVLYFLLGKKLQLHGGGNSVRSFIFINDVADGTLRAARQADPGEIFHFSTTENISIRAMVELIAERMGRSFDENVEIVGDRPGKDSAYLLDSTKAREQLGWQEKIELEQGVDKTIAWVNDNLDILQKQPFDYIHKQ